MITFTAGTTVLTLPPPERNTYLSVAIPRQYVQRTADGKTRAVTYADPIQRFSFTLINLTDEQFGNLINFLKGQKYSEDAFTFTDPTGTGWTNVKYISGIESAATQGNGYKRISLVLEQQD